jgi:hypothetical protein
VRHEAFDSPYSQIAENLRTIDANARQLTSRARKHIPAKGGRVRGSAVLGCRLGFWRSAGRVSGERRVMMTGWFTCG